MVGLGNSNWRHGLEYRIGFKKLKPLVIERDSKQCQWCGSKDGLVVHHIDSNKHNDVMENLITLCKSCHSRHHKLSKSSTSRLKMMATFLQKARSSITA